MVETKKKPSCGYKGERATEDIHETDEVGNVLRHVDKGSTTVGACHEGRCWYAGGLDYQPCPKCSVPDVEKVEVPVEVAPPEAEKPPEPPEVETIKEPPKAKKPTEKKPKGKK